LANDIRFFNQQSSSSMHHSMNMVGSDMILNTNTSSAILKYKSQNNFWMQVSLPFLIAKGTSSIQQGFTDIPFIVGKLFSINSIQKLNFGVGVKLPTSKNIMDDSFNNISVFGTGSFDPIIQLNHSLSMDRIVLRTDLFSRIATKNSDGNKFGNYYNLSINCFYQLFKSSCNDSARSPKFYDNSFAGIGLVGERFTSFYKNNVQDKNTGTELLYAAMNLSLSYKQFIFSECYMLPFYQGWTGMKSDMKSRMKTSISIKF